MINTKLAKTFLSLPDEKKNMITENILNAGLIMEFKGDYKVFLRKCKYVSLGKAKKIYSTLISLTDTEFGNFINIIIEGG